MSYLRVLMSFALMVSAEAYANDFPEVSIRQVRALNDDGDGSALEAELVRVTGVTTTGGRQYAPTSNCDNPPCTPGVGFYLDDGEAGIFVWSYLPSEGIDGLTVGQRVRVGGLVRSFQGRLMLTDFIDPACNSDSPPERCQEGSLPRIAPIIEVLEAEATPPEPVAMTLRGFLETSESMEGRLVSIPGVFSDDLSQRLPRAGTGGSFQLHDATVLPGQTPVPLYIEKTTDVAGQVWPERSQADLIAIADQSFRGGGAPGDNGRQLRARSWADFSNFRPREDEQWPQERTPIGDLRPGEGESTGAFEGNRVWIEGWLTTEFSTFRESRTGGVGFAVQDDTGGVIIRSNTIDHIWAPAAESALECQGNTDCSGGERCGPRSLCQEVVDLPELRSGVRVRVLGKVETRRGRLMIVDARLDDPLLIERLGAGGADEPAERVFAPVVVSARELLMGGEAYEGVLLTIKDLHLADANQQLPRSGQNGTFSVGDEENIRVGVHVERFACTDDEGAQVCVNRTSMSLPPESFSGERQWDLFQFDVTGIGDEITEGGGAGQRGLMPRSPADFSNFRDRRPPDTVVDAGVTLPPPPPRGGGGCGCATLGVDSAIWLLTPLVIARRRRNRRLNGARNSDTSV